MNTLKTLISNGFIAINKITGIKLFLDISCKLVSRPGMAVRFLTEEEDAAMNIGLEKLSSYLCRAQYNGMDAAKEAVEYFENVDLAGLVSALLTEKDSGEKYNSAKLTIIATNYLDTKFFTEGKETTVELLNSKEYTDRFDAIIKGFENKISWYKFPVMG
jgi:hypothetical protein